LIRWTRRQALIAAGLAPLAHAAGKKTRPPPPPAGAQEWRIATPGGAIRVYRPIGYRPRTAGVALYVHGFYTDVDQAWREHRLAEQFEASGRNALFIAPAARTASGEPIPWPDLAELLAMVSSDVGESLPRGPLVVAGHSGAYRQLAAWLPHPGLRGLLLLDALYGMQPEFRGWLRKRRANRMALVSHGTVRAATAFARRFRYAVRREHCPERFEELGARERRAKLLSMGTAVSHMGIVTEGKVLPLLLRWAGLPGRA
jgi:hypothetical protein